MDDRPAIVVQLGQADDEPPVHITVRPEALRPAPCGRCHTAHRQTEPCPSIGRIAA